MRRYGKWPGRPSGTAEDPIRCLVEIEDTTRPPYRPSTPHPVGGLRRRRHMKQCGNPRTRPHGMCERHYTLYLGEACLDIPPEE